LVIHRQSCWGPGVVVLTQSHDITSGSMGPVRSYGVTVDAWAWIGGYALLTGCHIGEKAVVAAGTVVRGQDVAPGVMVAGNPARVIARWDAHYEHWIYVGPSECGYERVLA
jgi:maltose O-acetyltransferase